MSQTFIGILSVHTCGECHVVFGMTEEMYLKRKSDGQTFYCPNGHARYFTESEITRLKRDLKYAEDSRTRAWEAHDTVKRKLNATRGVVTRIKHRVRNGVCPCCNRTFQNLMRHMKGKHPDYKEGANK